MNKYISKHTTKYDRKQSKNIKKSDRKRRSMIRKVKKMKKRLGVEDLYFYEYNGLFWCTFEHANTRSELNLINLKECMQNHTLTLINIDTKQEYMNFTELLKERIIIKLAGL